MKAIPTLLLTFVALFLFNALCMVSFSIRPTCGWQLDRNMVVGCVLWTVITTVQASVVFLPAWFFLRRKEHRLAVRYWLIAASILFTPCIVIWPEIAMGLLLPGPLALLFAAGVVSASLPNVHLTPGLCFKCSYNLTGNVSGVCPECGTPLQRAVETYV